jgi:YkoY family integral membrane protein
MLTSLLAIVYLVLLEGVLSVDNALALAALVRRRLSDPKDQNKALRYGIVCAYAFRVVVVFCGLWLLQFVWLKMLAAAYLMYLALSQTIFKSEEQEGSGEVGVRGFRLSPLLSTMIAVELTDITFSIDSISAAFSVSDSAWVLIAGACLGILLMRFAAQLFIRLIERFPSLETAAFVLVGLAGLKIFGGLVGYAIGEALFMGVIFGTVGAFMLFDVAFPHRTRAAQ